MKTLGEFIVEKQHEFSHATGELTALLSAIKPVSYTHLTLPTIA